MKGEGRGINNEGHAVFVFSSSNSESAVARGYVRLASGTLIELPPVDGDVTTYANDISETINDKVYIAGTTRTSYAVFRSVRWAVDATTEEMVSRVVRPDMSRGLAVSNAGGVAGFLEANALRTPRLTAFLWRGTNFLVLKPGKGGNNGNAWAASQSGEFVAGSAYFGLSRRAILWTILSP